MAQGSSGSERLGATFRAEPGLTTSLLLPTSWDSVQHPEGSRSQNLSSVVSAWHHASLTSSKKDERFFSLLSPFNNNCLSNWLGIFSFELNYVTFILNVLNVCPFSFIRIRIYMFYEVTSTKWKYISLSYKKVVTRSKNKRKIFF